MLSAKQIEIVKSTVPLLEGAGTAITEYFYKRMFSHHPELQHIFNMSNQHSGRQPFALFASVAAYAKHVDQPELLLDMVERIAHKHTSMNVLGEHYAVVGHHLIETLRELVPDQFTPEVEDAWKAAYAQLADIFIQREAKIYQDNAEQDGGWSGERRFVLKERRPESELVTSFIFEPLDGGPVASYQPGQYIGIQVEPESSEYREIRQYSLSAAPMDGRYQISVKREGASDDRPGVVSNYLHDQLQPGDEVSLYAPVGDFFLKPGEQDVVLISGGVGLTPMQAMLETSVNKEPSRSIYYLHACEKPAQHTFQQKNRALCDSGKVQMYTWYRDGATPSANEFEGLMNISQVQQLPVDSGEFYLCGPLPFMSHVKQQLIDLKVDPSRIHYEVFGPHSEV